MEGGEGGFTFGGALSCTGSFSGGRVEEADSRSSSDESSPHADESSPLANEPSPTPDESSSPLCSPLRHVTMDSGWAGLPVGAGLHVGAGLPVWAGTSRPAPSTAVKPEPTAAPTHSLGSSAFSSGSWRAGSVAGGDTGVGAAALGGGAVWAHGASGVSGREEEEAPVGSDGLTAGGEWTVAMTTVDALGAGGKGNKTNTDSRDVFLLSSQLQIYLYLIFFII